MSKAIRIHSHGGPEVLVYEEVAVDQPKAGEALIRHTAIGLNFLDVYYRTGLYPAPNGLPLVPGNEGAGVVEALGEGVTGLQVGDRVAYVGPLGAYAEQRIIAADRLVKLPDTISDEQGAAMMLQGMTAEYLLRRTYPVKAGDTILCHAAAGGVGLILGQWAKHLGATVIGTAGSAEKVELAKAHGYDHVIDYSREDFVARVHEITGGAKCEVVYDSVGKETYEGSIDCLKPRGMFVIFGQSSGQIPPLDMAALSKKGSLFVTRPTLFTYIAKREDLEESSQALFDVVAKGIVKINVNQRYSLADAEQAHRDLEGRKTTGTTILLP
jgi:NADPH2:quinone reductase